ncbi:hypothetical protein ACS0TY_013266 [Phlomoides rotata]
MIDFYDLLRVLSGITRLDLNMYTLNLSSIINGGNSSSRCPIRNNRDLRFFFDPNIGFSSIELLVEYEVLVQSQNSNIAWENYYYQSFGSSYGGGHDFRPSDVTYEVPHSIHNAWDGWENQYYQSLGSSDGGGNDPNVGPLGDNSIIDLPCDYFGANAPHYSEPSNYGSSDDGSPDEGDNADNSSIPRVAPHPNLANVPFFSSLYEDVPIDSIDIPRGSLIYDADDGVLKKGMIFKDKKHLQSVVKDYSVRYAKREYIVVQSTPTV